MKKWLYLGLVVVLLVGVFGVSGCGGTEGSPFLTMLEFIPDTPATRFQVYISDHARIREIYDVPLPLSDADDEAMVEYMIALRGQAPLRFVSLSFISGMGPLQYALVSPIRRQNIGFGPLDVDVDIYAGVAPTRYEVIKGNFDLAGIKDTLSQYDESVSPDIDSYRDIKLYIWTYEVNQIFQYNRLEPPVFDELGRGTTLAVQEDYICSVDTPELVETMIDASQGGTTSLADNADYSLMATALSEMGAYSCYLSNQLPFVYSDMYIDLLITSSGITEDEIASAAGELLGRYRTLASGIGEDEEGPFMTIVLIYDSPQQASSDTTVFERRVENGVSLWTGEPWQDMVDSSDIWAEGRSLRIKLRGDIVLDWLDILFTRDTLLWRGE